MDHTASKRNPGRKEVTTRMPVALADQLRQAAASKGMTVNDLLVALAEAFVERDRSVDAAAEEAAVAAVKIARRRLRQSLSSVLQQLGADDDEELPVSA